MKQTSSLLVSSALVALIASCGGADKDPVQAHDASQASSTETAPAADAEEEHEHAEDPLGTVTIGDLSVELAQGHGAVVAGEEDQYETDEKSRYVLHASGVRGIEWIAA